MKNFINNHIDQLKDYCLDNNLSVDKILNAPKSYNKQIMFIQHYKECKKGLKDETPAKILLTITKNGGKLIFEPCEDIELYLS